MTQHGKLIFIPAYLALPVLCACQSIHIARNFEFDPQDKLIETSVWDNPNFYDADTVAYGNKLWVVWLEFVPDQGDIIHVECRQNGKPIFTKKVTTQAGKYANPTITIDRNKNLWLSYEAETLKQWDIFVTTLQDDKSFSPAWRVTDGPGPDINHRTAADPVKGIWMVWQSDRNGQFDILAARISEKDKVQVSNVSKDSPMGDWHPDIAVTPGRAVFVAWDAYDGESYNVYTRIRVKNSWNKIAAVTSSPAFEGRVSLTPDNTGRAWIAWEEGADNWGKHYLNQMRNYPARYLNITDKYGPMHRFRLLRLGLLHKNGSISFPKHSFPMPSFDRALKRLGPTSDIQVMGTFYERAKLSVDRYNRLWIAYRHYYTPWYGLLHKHHIEEGWQLYARYLDAGGWSKVHRFDIGQGDGMQRLEITPTNDGIAAVWTTGRTDRRNNTRPRGIVVGRVNLAGTKTTKAPRVTGLIDFQRKAPIMPPNSGRTKPMSTTVAGRTYKLFYGDLHRHTDLSLCFVHGDGTIDDAYRYAVDVAKLDFLGITDHARDIAKGDASSQLWWRSCKEVLRHQLTPNFFPFFSYELSQRGVDSNVISLRTDTLRPYTYKLTKFWEELDDDTFTIPHQTGTFPRRKSPLFVPLKHWNTVNNRRQPLLEIYQGCRNRSIEGDAHEALARGHRIGFIASSDHLSTSASYVGVWAEKSRVSIFRAMQARRTFGATDKIRLFVQAGNYCMGEEISADDLPPVEIQVDGTAPVDKVELFLDGRLYRSFNPEKKQFKRKVIVKELPAGKHYLYTRIRQEDGNAAWSSPIWFNTN